MLLYKRTANKCLAQQMGFTHRRYCALNFKFPRGEYLDFDLCMRFIAISCF